MTNIRYKRILFEINFYLTFRTLLHTSNTSIRQVKVNFKKDAFISDVCHRCLYVNSDQTEMAKEKEYFICSSFLQGISANQL